MNAALDWYRSLKMNRPTLGVDIGDRNLKGISLKMEGDKVVLDDIFMLDLAEGAADYPENRQVAQKLSAVIEVNNLIRRKVGVAGGGKVVGSFDLTLPLMEPNELKLVVQKNLEDTLRTDIDSFCYDYKVIHGSTEGMVHVRIYHSDRKDVDNILNIVEKAKLKPVLMSTAILAAAEMLKFNDYTSPDKASILIDLGESATSTSLLIGHDVVASNSTNMGFGLINKNLMEALNCTYADAEAIKPYIANLSEVDNAEAEKITDESFMTILESLQEIVDYYRSQDVGVPIGEIFFVGGGTVFGDVRQIFEDHYHIPTTIVNPFRNIETLKLGDDPAVAAQIEKLAPFMATAVGLALEGIDR